MNNSSLLNKALLGRRGEGCAIQYLLSRGYQIIAKNHRLGHRELDLIARKNGFFHFCEIKTRRQRAGQHSLRNPFSSDSFISQRQIINLKKAALFYVAQNSIPIEKCSFDLIVIFVDTDSSRAKLKHYQKIF